MPTWCRHIHVNSATAVFRDMINMSPALCRSRRRARLSGLYFALLVVQIVNAVFWLVPNAYVLAARCRWYNPPVQWCVTLL